MEPFDLPPEIFGQVPLFAEIAKAMSWTGGPVNWDIARQIATATAAGEQTMPIIDADRAELTDAARLTQAWLQETTGVTEASTPPRVDVLTPQAWVERALGTFPEVIDPLAAKLTNAVAREQPEEAPELPLAKILGQLVPLFLGIQAGTVVGGLSRRVLTTYDVPLPLEEDGTISIVVAHVDDHAKEYGLDRRELRYWTALRGVATRLLFEALPWTRTHFFSLYHQYLAGVDIDMGDAIEHLQQMDITSPEQLQDALGNGLFGLGDTPVAGAALGRLHRYLALVEGTTSRAVAASAAGRLNEASRIAESFARRRSAEGERLLERFLGLEIPEDVERAAGAFCDRVLQAGGWSALNELWSDPDRMPSAEDLADPDSWLYRAT